MPTPQQLIVAAFFTAALRGDLRKYLHWRDYSRAFSALIFVEIYGEGIEAEGTRIISRQ